MTENELDYFLKHLGSYACLRPKVRGLCFFTLSLQFFAVHYSFSSIVLLNCDAFVNYLDNPTDSKEILNEKVALRS
jgi:hypothetical protein